jgi:hypothetical protein
LNTDTTLRSETDGAYSYTTIEQNVMHGIPQAAKDILDGYKVYRA